MLELTLPTMTCGHCVATVTKAIQQADPQARVEIDLGTHLVRVQTEQPRDSIVLALAQAGYEPG
jgi:copper chaperone